MREKLSDIEHTRWSGWQAYLHSKCVKNEDGSLTIPVGYVVHLERLINTPYDKLTEKEKDSDRAEVNKNLLAIRQELLEKLPEEANKFHLPDSLVGGVMYNEKILDSYINGFNFCLSQVKKMIEEIR